LESPAISRVGELPATAFPDKPPDQGEEGMMAKIDPKVFKGERLGRILRRLGRCSREQVYEALHLQKEQKRRLGELLVELDHCTQMQITEALSLQRGFQMVNLEGRTIEEDVLASIPPETVRAYGVVPLKYDASSRRILIAMKTPDNYRALDDLSQLMDFKVQAVVAPAEQVDALIKEHFSGATDLGQVLAKAEDSSALGALSSRGESIDLGVIEEAAADNQIIELLDLVLRIGIQEQASDIHFEPFEDQLRIRQRIDGVLYEMAPVRKHLAMAIISRVKVMANLDIAERRLPQDGRIEMMGRDLRVSILPTMFGESAVLRILDRDVVSLDIDNIGLRDEDLADVETIIRKPNGIVIVTGPTGSGKTTTLYAALTSLNDAETKILTAENPVEYDIDGLIQCQVNTEQDLTFAALLRSFLRQDPDVILVGEIRDLETAQIAIQASLTGHLVFATLHTNDAPSTVLRLTDLGVESFLLTATIEAIIAQRLVRRICSSCREEFTPTLEQLMELQLKPEDIEGRTLYRGAGCDNCHGGYKGRMALFEIMSMNDEMRELIISQASTSALRAEARALGMRTLRESGLMSLYEGQTTIDEVVRETITDE
jgi:type IV pilus assembly protein PilB